jgi:hypothetical protein
MYASSNGIYISSYPKTPHIRTQLGPHISSPHPYSVIYFLNPLNLSCASSST